METEIASTTQEQDSKSRIPNDQKKNDSQNDNEEAAKNTVDPTLALKLVCEFVGTLGLSYTVSATIAAGDVGGGVPVPVCAAFYLILMVYGIGSVSGCHINPGVSTAVFTWGALSGTNPSWYIEYPLYVLVQTLGGIIGGVIGTSMAANNETYGTVSFMGIYPFRDQDEMAGIGMVGEMLAIFFFTFTILRVCCDHDKPPMATDGIVIGIALMTAICGTAGVSGGGVNPAVATSLRVANYWLDDKYETLDKGDFDHFNEFSFFMVYWIGPILGALMAAGFHYLIEKQTSVEFTGYEFLHKGRIHE